MEVSVSFMPPAALHIQVLHMASYCPSDDLRVLFNNSYDVASNGIRRCSWAVK
jgi:hypothetical protein